jgi:hypothetical protein
LKSKQKNSTGMGHIDITNAINSMSGEDMISSNENELIQTEDEWQKNILKENVEKDFDGSITENAFKHKDDFALDSKTKIGGDFWREEGKQLPKTSFTIWYMEALRLKALEESITSLIPNAYIHPLSGIQASVVVFQIYNTVRHGLQKIEKNKNVDTLRLITIDKNIAELNKYCKGLGYIININGGNEADINWQEYHKFLDKLLYTWSMIEETIADLGMKIPFDYQDAWKTFLRNKRNIPKYIDSTESETPKVGKKGDKGVQDDQI